MAESTSLGNLTWPDILVIVLYFVISIAVGVWTIWKTNRSSVKGFYLAGRSMTWWTIGMSLFASNIGSNNFVGIAGSGANSGLAVVMFEWSAVFLLVLLGWVFLPIYIASGIFTMPEYLERRFGGKRLRIYLSIVALITYLFATLSTDLFAGALFLQQTLGWNIYLGVFIILAVTVVYTGMGGLETVIMTDAMAVVVMVLGGVVLSIIGLVKIGGYEGLRFQYERSIPEYTYRIQNTSCGFPREDAFHIFRGWTADYPGLGTFLRSLIGSLWYWCANQVLVQRALSAKSITHAKGACVFAAYLKLTPFFIIVLPGMISRALYPDEVACADPETCDRVCGNTIGCSNIAYPKMVVELLPEGLRGLLLAVMVAAVISSLTSIFNSSSTIFSMDLYTRVRPRAGQRELITVGRLFVIAMTAIAVMWIPLMQSAEGGEIFKYATTITGYLASPTCAMFLLAVFWNRVNEPGAFYGMLISQLFGIVRFIMEFAYVAPACGEPDERPSFIKDINGYYYSLIQILIAFIIAYFVSIFTKPIPDIQFRGLTYWTRHEKPLKDIEREEKDAMKAKLEALKITQDIGSKTWNDIDDTTEYSNGTDYRIGEEISPTEPVDEYESAGFSCRNWLKKILFGEELKQGQEAEDDEYEPHAVRLASIKQPLFWKWFMDINAIIVVAVCIFLYGFFA